MHHSCSAYPKIRNKQYVLDGRGGLLFSIGQTIVVMDDDEEGQRIVFALALTLYQCTPWIKKKIGR
jgi:hypothetical protein